MKKNLTHSLKDPLAKAKGSGTAKAGNHHWKMQRLSALALLLLLLWLLAHIVWCPSVDWKETVIWGAQPLNATLLMLLTVTAFYHGSLGLQVVIEDYIHCSCIKNTVLVFSNFLFVLLAVLSIVFIIKILLLGFVI